MNGLDENLSFFFSHKKENKKIKPLENLFFKFFFFAQKTKKKNKKSPQNGGNIYQEQGRLLK
jgi:hypothetical protein